NDFVLKIQPDLIVLAAIISATWHRSLLTHCATASATLQMRAVPILFLRDHVGLAQIPMHDAFTNVLLREGERKTTTCSLAKMNAILTINLHLTLESVFVVLRLLQEDAHPFFTLLLYKPLGDFRLACVKLIDRQQPFFAEQLYQAV